MTSEKFIPTLQQSDKIFKLVWAKDKQFWLISNVMPSCNSYTGKEPKNKAVLSYDVEQCYMWSVLYVHFVPYEYMLVPYTYTCMGCPYI